MQKMSGIHKVKLNMVAIQIPDLKCTSVFDIQMSGIWIPTTSSKTIGLMGLTCRFCRGMVCKPALKPLKMSVVIFFTVR